MRRVLCVGECMVEVRRLDAETARLGYAGDTYNTAVYLRRVATELGVPAEVGYLTGLGRDAYSAEMRARWAAEGIVDRSLTIDGHQVGLYAVQVDASGERSFTYWRGHSAARAMFAGTGWVERLDADLVHLSGITLQIAAPEARRALLAELRRLRGNGTRISFDTNYRAGEWNGPAQAAEAMDQVCSLADTVFATFEDEAAMHGCADPRQAAHRLAALGVPQVVVKSGAHGADLLTGGVLRHVPARPVARVVDTTAAGDAFAGAYLAATLAGRPPLEAVRTAVGVAAEVVTHPGAITPRGLPLLEAGTAPAAAVPPGG